MTLQNVYNKVGEGLFSSVFLFEVLFSIDIPLEESEMFFFLFSKEKIMLF